MIVSFQFQKSTGHSPELLPKARTILVFCNQTKFKCKFLKKTNSLILSKERWTRHFVSIQKDNWNAQKTVDFIYGKLHNLFTNWSAARGHCFKSIYLGRETVLFFLIVLCARFSRQNTFLRRRTLRTWLYTCVVTILGLACQSNKMFPITKRYSSTKTSTRSKNSRRIVGTG